MSGTGGKQSGKRTCLHFDNKLWLGRLQPLIIIICMAYVYGIRDVGSVVEMVEKLVRMYVITPRILKFYKITH